MRISADKRDSFRFSSRRIWDKSLPPTIHSVSSSFLSSYANFPLKEQKNYDGVTSVFYRQFLVRMSRLKR